MQINVLTLVYLPLRASYHRMWMLQCPCSSQEQRNGCLTSSVVAFGSHQPQSDTFPQSTRHLVPPKRFQDTFSVYYVFVCLTSLPPICNIMPERSCSPVHVDVPKLRGMKSVPQKSNLENGDIHLTCTGEERQLEAFLSYKAIIVPRFMHFGLRLAPMLQLSEVQLIAPKAELTNLPSSTISSDPSLGSLIRPVLADRVWA